LHKSKILFTDWLRCVAQLAERRSLAGELTLFCARPEADVRYRSAN